MLEVRNLSVAYGKHMALQDVSIDMAEGEALVILGANGAGKSTLLKSVAGMVRPAAGASIEMLGQSLIGMPQHEVVETGIAVVPEGRGVFAALTVRENLLLGAYPRRARAQEAANLDKVLTLFPRLAERRRQTVSTMSGGEQQMVAIGRALMSSPRLLMLDEPSLGLAPVLVGELFQSLAAIRQSGVGLLIVEQNVKISLSIADRGYLLEAGRIVGQGTAETLANDPAVQNAFLGVAAHT
ncbi:ABC transporter ATP-binding protein [Puniceibacterium sediminis]|uniref:Amino acid/amide ABC transporter ATP-binding protein 2, HAAT family n=1 Tax=Puniceibacterium sediminis TaxID=1608407 RepID=A0A238Y6P4_9RHOB|nr:ABC transporter ATP-binding protein [Puniceibacterium sediminis]SNR66622.1 amino acid/amide ABC transporter ATP-binding protein 2, HAAT family [Puniceibacterium sediminis]